MCFASMAGCKTKLPRVAHPYVQEYVAGREHGNVKAQIFFIMEKNLQLGQMKMEKRYLKTLRKHLRR
ncbi:MAG: hypothetical protein ACLS9K_04680 [Lachnospira eligens]